MATWQKVGENLVRHSGGVIYLRGRVNGKPIRVSLGTSDLRIAKIARDARLASLRSEAKNDDLTSPKTIGDFLKIVETQTILPHLKQTTMRNYRYTFGTLHKSLDTTRKAQGYTSEDASAWWRKYTTIGCAQTVNLGLALMKRLGALLMGKGLVNVNPFAHLKRIAIGRQFKTVPTSDQIDAVMQSIRDQKLPYSEEAANFVGFLAYSGLRISEANTVLWRDITEDWLIVTGGKKLTKNRKFRKVPISEHLKLLLSSMRQPGITPETPVFTIVTPRLALQGACKRLGLPHIHPHLLRHYFATWAIERGVDIPTVSRWLGHSDGGVLAMKTYGHIRDDHSLAQIKKLDS